MLISACELSVTSGAFHVVIKLTDPGLLPSVKLSLISDKLSQYIPLSSSSTRIADDDLCNLVSLFPPSLTLSDNPQWIRVTIFE
jgi:hypothetical protein